ELLITLLETALINKILHLNRTSASLNLYRAKAGYKNTSFLVTNGLLYYKRKLIVLKDKDARIYFIRDIYLQMPITYLGKVKIRKLV
ncbi:hypothetical protein GE21DRAFT_1215763, partial [Neurospora crassa]